MFFRPLCCHVLGEKNTYRPQFPAPLGTMFEIIWTNREKWKLRFRTRVDMKIKLSRHAFSWLSWILWACFLDVSFSDPLCNFLSYFTSSCSHLESIFDEILQSFWQRFSSTKKSKKFDYMCSPGGGTQGPSKKRGEPGGTQEASRSPGPFRGHFFHKSSPLSHQMQKLPQIGDFTMCFWRSVSDSLVFTMKMSKGSRQRGDPRSKAPLPTP